MASTLSYNKLPFTSHSLTSIKYQQSNKIDKIIIKLQKRKQQLIEILSQNKNLHNHQTSKLNTLQLKAITQNNAQNTKQLKNIQTLIQRKQKYTAKIEKQRTQYTNIQQQIKQINNKIMQCVIHLQQNQIQLKNISQSIGQRYRYCFGIKQDNYLSNQKWILFRILELESLLENSQLNMRIILCQFYREQNKIQKFGDDVQLPSFWLVEYVVKYKLVNKLYGRILQNKKYRVQYSNQKPVRQESQQQIQQQQIQQQQIQSPQQNEDQSKLQRSKLQNNKNKDTNKYHDLWLQILKLMKILEKLEPTSTRMQEIQTSTKTGINISQLQASFAQKIKQANIIKKTCKLLSEQIKISKTKIQQLTQQLKIKQQLISNMKQKIKQLDKQITQQTKIYQNNKKNQYKITLQKKQSFQKQFKEIEQAIKYFIIKKNTHCQNYQKNNVESFTHFKSIEDNTTCYLSPQKTTVNNGRFVSPDMFSTNKKSNKYSLKYLLSPQKQLTMQSKKKAWK